MRWILPALGFLLAGCEPDWTAIEDADGDGFSVADGDCDDLNPEIGPGASENWYDGVDDDCDGNDDDQDGDGYVAAEVGGEDCDDADAEVSPDGEEIWYDGVDGDCDGASDYDADGDGHGAEGNGGNDCDDNDPSISPDMDEVWYDGIDQNCDGNDDDQDGDGYAVDAECDDTDPDLYPNSAEEIWYDCVDQSCDGNDGDQDGDGYVPDDYAETCDWTQFSAHVDIGDCDDTAGEVNPGASEVWYDGVDDDCDGNDDDQDGDGYGWDGAPGGEDCDDTSADVNPGQTESCATEVDDDCDGEDNALDAIDCVDWYVDGDGDGYGGEATACYCDPGVEPFTAANTGDCDDADSGLNPETVWYRDGDADGYGDAASTATGCEQPSGYVADATDCDDADAEISPDALETCDGLLDEDCDGLIDESEAIDATTWYADEDGDGYGNGDNPAQACEQPSGYVADATDCDDGDDELTDARTWYADADEDGYGDPDVTYEAGCEEPTGYVLDSADCDDDRSDVNPGADEYCDGSTDEDCDDDVDEEGAVDASTFYRDADLDGYGDAASTATACEQPSGYVADATDCDDLSGEVYPGADEYCDGFFDEDCDSAVDEDGAADATTWYADTDGDSYGDAATSATSCSAPSGFVADATDCDDSDPFVLNSLSWYTDADGDGYGDEDASALVQCDEPSGYSTDNTDCDDGDGAINPAADELCDDGGVDEDCDDLANDDDPEGVADPTSWYRDLDADGYGDPADQLDACDQPSGYVSNSDDCDDIASTINPEVDEICDTLDNDCDAETDESGALDAATWYADGDADGYGDAASTATACDQPSGYVADATDCDDAAASANPDADEYCDGLDNDCDGDTDEDDAVDVVTWYEDKDGDGYGDTTSAAIGCDQPSGYVAESDDCDDERSDVNPGADEYCDGSTDEDCDDDVDEEGAVDASTFYRDADLDGYGNPSSSQVRCDQPSGYVTDDTDCNDLASGTNPGADEICDEAGSDEDCDGFADDADPEGATDASDSGYPDADGDGYGGDTEGLWCAPVADATDCDDADSDSYPGAAEQDDVVDNDCDEWVDEDFIAYGDLIFSEVMIDPQGVDEGYEWMELYNASDRTLRLDGWSFTLDSGASFTLSPDAALSMEPGDYAVLCEDTAAVIGVDCDYEYGTSDNGLTDSVYGPALDDDWELDNTSDVASILLDALLIDALGWDKTFGITSRYSLELSTSTLDADANDDPLNWCAAVDVYDFSYGNYGSPGAENACEL